MIELRNVSKYYGKKPILRKINLHVKKSEFIAVMGRSGSGKTTMLNILGGMDRFEEGHYFFNGMDVGSLSTRNLAFFRRNIGFVFQAFHLIKSLSVLENVEMPLGYAGFPKKERRKIALDMLGMVGLEKKKWDYPSELSGGQQQRVAIARALVNKSEVILADEPTGNLDSKNAVQIMELIKSLHEQGTGVILVTHDEKMASYAGRKVVLKDGEIMEDTLH